MLLIFNRLIKASVRISRRTFVVSSILGPAGGRGGGKKKKAASAAPPTAKRWSGVVVGEIQSIRQHPTADRLQICQVQIAQIKTKLKLHDGGYVDENNHDVPHILSRLEEKNSEVNPVEKTTIAMEENERSLSMVQIICGASNVQVAQKVPVATVGTRLPISDR